jgi:hypothetical protein
VGEKGEYGYSVTRDQLVRVIFQSKKGGPRVVRGIKKKERNKEKEFTELGLLNY